MNIVNQYSYVIILLMALLVVYVLLRRYLNRRWWVVVAAQMLLIAAFAGGFFMLRPGSSNVSNLDMALSMLENGRPTFVEFFSNYCSGCLSLNPIIENIVSNIEDEYNILRVNIHTPIGRSLRQELGFSFTPEFIIYDVAGQEIWRDHIPPTATQLNAGRQLNQVQSQQ